MKKLNLFIFLGSIMIFTKNNISVKNELLVQITLLIFIATFFVLFVFQPFGDITHGFMLIGVIRILSYSLTAAMVYFLLEKYLRPVFFSKIRSDRRSAFIILWFLIEISVLAVGIYLCRSFWVGNSIYSLESFLLVLYRVIAVGVIPMALIFLLFPAYKKTQKPTPTLIFQSNDKNPEYLKIDLDKIHYLQSEDNYTKIYFEGPDNMTNRLLRGSLSYFSAQLEDSFLRIHKSTIVNLHAVQSIEINSQGGTVVLKDGASHLRISRSFVPDFRIKWEHFQETM